LKRAVIFLILLFGPYISSCQKIDGVWMSYNNRVVKESEQYTSGQEGFILDFESKTLGHISSNSVIKFKINRYKIKIKELNQKVRIKVFGNDSIEFPPSGNMISVFHRLKLDNKTRYTKDEIVGFLTGNQFDTIYGLLDIEFSTDQYWIDKRFNEDKDRFDLINNTWNEPGYWYLKRIDDVYFLILNFSQIDEKHIYQILEVNKDRMKLKPLQDGTFRPKQLTELRIRL
tara:strand:+ start:1006 stop:1692 length:687 start_codon:yes stop_codon:yes gene_type:complete